MYIFLILKVFGGVYNPIILPLDTPLVTSIFEYLKIHHLKNIFSETIIICEKNETVLC